MFLWLLSITKLQNLKAIHNQSYIHSFLWRVVINHKTTKFESNSQPLLYPWTIILSCYQSQNYKIWKQFTTTCSLRLLSLGCYQSQNYKIWKQFTTPFSVLDTRQGLLSITKLQNLKAIHNLYWAYTPCQYVVINHKTTKFESNSQLVSLAIWFCSGCYQSQNYKIWKQFTTTETVGQNGFQLLSITKLQNLKAIHN